MDDLALREALNSYVTTDEPPTKTLMPDLVTAGRRSRRRHRFTLLASGLAVVMVTAGATVGIAYALSPRAGTPGASLAMAACPSSALRGAGSPEVRMTCYLASVVPRMLGDVSFIRLYGPRGTLPLQVYPATQAPGSYEASAEIRDAEGAGSVIFLVMRQSGPTPTRDFCASKGGCSVREGPHGELVEVIAGVSPQAADFSAIDATVYVYTGRTVILATTSNAVGRSDDGRSIPARAAPPLTTEQLIELATAPELALFD
jgi:hypothetical protein